MFNHKQGKIDLLKMRVHELEEKLCPSESHQWILVEVRYSEPYCRYRCSKCGKEKCTDQRFDDILEELLRRIY